MLTDKYFIQRNWLGVLFGFCLEFAVMWGLFIENIIFYVIKSGDYRFVIHSDLLADWLLVVIIIYYGFFYRREHDDNYDQLGEW
ncbi:MAG: hypothetical protein DRH37_04090 [Deltaproteobacteria bacterium]|nr:MAG: hypothetical protein DRH37_04090 [Deltaproteobacteria bacterium]